jgi:hypothetical protein
VKDSASDRQDRARQRQSALSRWENEGGASLGPSKANVSPEGKASEAAPPLTDAELIQLQVRMIALESLVIALLAEASDAQLQLARDMVAFISPRPGFTPHRLTLHAASQMRSLLERAGWFRSPPVS